MRSTVTTLLSCACLLASAQSEWTSLFRTDPEHSDGYFIVDQDKADALGVVRVEVDIIASELQPNGSTNSRVVETLVIEGGFHAHADFDLWAELEDPYRVHYHAQGFDGNNDPVVDVQSVPEGHQPWPEVCRETCESNLYAYTLTAYSNGALAFIAINNGTVNGEAARLYVKASNWAAFTNMFDPWEHFGIGGGEWTEIYDPISNPDQTSVIRLNYPAQTPPPGARDYQGYLLGWVTEDVYAVAKGKGPWRDLFAHTGDMASQAVCIGPPGHLRPIYNEDDVVENALAINEMDPLECMGVMVNGTMLDWGSGWNSPWCTTYTIDPGTSTDPPSIVIGIAYSTIACAITDFVYNPNGIPEPGGSGPNGDYTLADVANILVYQWAPGEREEVMSVPVGGIIDPRLWQVTKIDVPGGLYEFRVILNNGRMLKRFVEFDGPTTLSADFAAFTHITVYPVPVREDRFAIDFDLYMPMDISLTIVNNMGVTYYTKALSYPLSGLNKHVVEMASAWPEGLYHAVFQYVDGSTESVSFTVDY